MSEFIIYDNGIHAWEHAELVDETESADVAARAAQRVNQKMRGAARHYEQRKAQIIEEARRYE